MRGLRYSPTPRFVTKCVARWPPGVLPCGGADNTARMTAVKAVRSAARCGTPQAQREPLSHGRGLRPGASNLREGAVLNLASGARAGR